MPQSYNEKKYKEAIQKSQEILRKYLVPGSGQTMDNTVNALLGILDDKELAALLRMDKSLYLLEQAAFAHVDTLKDLQINYLKNAVRNLEQTNKLLRDTKPNLPDAIDIVVEALSKDKTPGGYYYSWIANIAMAIKIQKENAQAKVLLRIARDLTDSPTLQHRIDNFLNVKK